jgi:hypothetical protein
VGWIAVDGRLANFRMYAAFINRIYIAFTTPVYIGFDLRLTGWVLILEVFSHLIAFVNCLLEFRKPVMMESGEQTLAFKYVYRNYKKNGLVFDIISFLPFILLPLSV